MSTSESLRHWSRIFRGMGRIEEADLLDKAADIIERGDRDPEIALQMAAWQAMVADSQYQSLVSLLGDASVALRPN
jgi:hypothetical protein